MTVLALAFASPAHAGPEGRIRVIDADTMDVGQTRVRLFGIDAPERDQTCQRKSDGAIWACGAWATETALRAFDGKSARCTAKDTDRYGRTVATCRVGGRDMGATLIARGAATAYTRYTDLYVDAEKAARVTGTGIFSSNMMSPDAYRDTRNTQTSNKATTDCTIKGNISKNGRIYHLPGQKFYANTRISPSKGERWFCTENEARAAGWRRARQ